MTGQESGGQRVVTPALLKAARDVYRDAIRRELSEGGFEDLPKNGPFVLGAMVNFGFPSSDVIKELGVTKQAASQLIDALVIRGYLERVPEPDDRRRILLKPTERGRGAAAASRTGVRRVDAELSKRHIPMEIGTFRACLFSLVEIGRVQREERSSTEPRAEPTPTRLLKFSPIFAVRDLRLALDHYRDLGFQVRAYAEGDGYGFAARDGLNLHLSAEASFDPERDASETYLYVEDADALAAEWSRPGIGGRTTPVRTTEYKMREGGHFDPDNNLIRFGSDLKEDRDPYRTG